MRISNPQNGYEAVEKAVMEQMATLYGFTNESILVRIGKRYSHEDEYTYSTELLMNDGEDWATPKYIWESDWWEGEQEIKIFFAAPISEFEFSPDERFRM